MKEAREDKLSVPALGALFLVLVGAAASFLVLIWAAALSLLVQSDSFAEAGARVQADLVTLTLAQLVGMGLSLWMGLRWFGPDVSAFEGLHLYAIRKRTVALCLLAGACLQFPLNELANLLRHYVLGPDALERQLALQQMLEAPSLVRGLVVVTCVVAAIPVMEELFFRGFLLFGMRARYGDGAAIVGSACLFGIAHWHYVTAVYAAIAGLLLGFLALRTRSIWPGIALHAAVNAMPVLLPERLFPLRGFNVPSIVPLHLPLWLVLSTLALGVVFLAGAVKVEYQTHDD